MAGAVVHEGATYQALRDTGHAVALPSPAMNSRRLMAIPPERER